MHPPLDAAKHHVQIARDLLREGKENLKDVVAMVVWFPSLRSDLVETIYLKEVPKANSGRDIVMLDASVSRDTNAPSTDIIAIPDDEEPTLNRPFQSYRDTLDERNLVKEHSFIILLNRSSFSAKKTSADAFLKRFPSLRSDLMETNYLKEVPNGEKCT
ncbi:hypothetical protein Tco_0421324 [Tanacetum coccineum]